MLNVQWTGLNDLVAHIAGWKRCDLHDVQHVSLGLDLHSTCTDPAHHLITTAMGPTGDAPGRDLHDMRKVYNSAWYVTNTSPLCNVA